MPNRGRSLLQGFAACEANMELAQDEDSILECRKKQASRTSYSISQNMASILGTSLTGITFPRRSRNYTLYHFIRADIHLSTSSCCLSMPRWHNQISTNLRNMALSCSLSVTERQNPYTAQASLRSHRSQQLLYQAASSFARLTCRLLERFMDGWHCPPRSCVVVRFPLQLQNGRIHWNQVTQTAKSQQRRCICESTSDSSFHPLFSYLLEVMHPPFQFRFMEVLSGHS
eukprot:GILJ01012868.1.p1 GENE.GILJ01012868.1~~GILJ01012868.1.p1  ORF type:complete len:229 (+),score=15.79 GILJ01012868.1:87-773(+)